MVSDQSFFSRYSSYHGIRGDESTFIVMNYLLVRLRPSLISHCPCAEYHFIGEDERVTLRFELMKLRFEVEFILLELILLLLYKPLLQVNFFEFDLVRLIQSLKTCYTNSHLRKILMEYSNSLFKTKVRLVLESKLRSKILNMI